MDTLAHGLWSHVMYKVIPATRNNRKTTLWGIAFGVLPDLVSFTPIFIYFFGQLILGRAQFGRPDLETNILAQYAQHSYNYTHSLAIFSVVFILCWLLLRKFPWVLLGWSLHIVIDIFTHPDFYQTPYLFPLSDVKNTYAVSWAHPVFMIINYSLLLVLYLVIIPRIKAKTSQ